MSDTIVSGVTPAIVSGHDNHNSHELGHLITSNSLHRDISDNARFGLKDNGDLSRCFMSEFARISDRFADRISSLETNVLKENYTTRELILNKENDRLTADKNQADLKLFVLQNAATNCCTPTETVKVK